MKVLVTGASGTIGQVLMDALKEKSIEAYAFDRTAIDIKKQSEVNKYLNDLKPTVIYHLAKSSLEFTDMLGQWVFDNQAKLIYTSSFKVFSSKNTQGPHSIFDIPDGTDSFAKDKIAQERCLFEYYPYTQIVRLAWQISHDAKGHTFLNFVKKQMEKDGEFNASRSHFISFMFIEDTVEHLMKFPTHFPSGLFHLNANEFFSVYDLLKNLKEQYKHDWLKFNDQKKVEKNETMKSNLEVETFSDKGFKFSDK